MHRKLNDYVIKEAIDLLQVLLMLYFLITVYDITLTHDDLSGDSGLDSQWSYIVYRNAINDQEV